jgi:uncharacterized protein (TIGR03437 family)
MRPAILFLLPVLGLAQSYTVSMFAGGGSNIPCSGMPLQSVFSSPKAVAVDSAGNVYIADTGLYQVCKVSAGTITVLAGNGTPFFGIETSGQAVNTAIGAPSGLAVDSSGNVYISDQTNNVVLKVTPGGALSIFAGTGNPGYTGDHQQATSATLNTPQGLAVDASGNVYIADGNNYVVRVVAPNGVITTFAGGGTAQSTGSGIAATSMSLGYPRGLAVDSAGSLYIGASFQVFKVSNGIITTVAGDGNPGYSGNGGPAVDAWLDGLGGVGVDSSGNVFFSDWGNNVIWEVSSGTIQVIAGDISLPVGNTGNGGPATSASFNEPMGLTVGGGNVYIADTFDNVIRELTPAGSGPPTIESGGVVTASSWGDFSSAAPGSWIEIYGTNLATAPVQWAASNFNGLTGPTSLNGTSVTIGGVPAFVEYVSSLQLDVQVPSNVSLGSEQVVVTTPSGAQATSSIAVAQTDPGLLAPAVFLVGGIQYVAALFSDDSTYVMPPGTVGGVTSRAANPGEVITLYGVGFGTVTPSTPAGQIASGQTQLTSSLKIYFAGTQAQVSYAGLSPESVGLYQFDVTVPNVAAGASVPLTFTLNGVDGAQTLYTAVQ